MGKQRPFAVFDIDGTLIRWQLYHAVADSLAKRGSISEDSFLAIREARMKWKQRQSSDSFREYEMELVKIYVNILAEITAGQLDEAAETVFQEYKDQVYTYTRDLMKKLKKQGYLIFAISGSQTEILEKMAAHYKFDGFIGREDERSKGRFTGKSTTPIFAKDKAVRELVSKHGATFSGSIGVGDSHTDIRMLELVERPIAFNPEKSLFEHARRHKWKIIIERKNVIYELNSYDGTYVLV